MNTIITGATQGIGRAIAEKFAEQGSNLILSARTRTDLEELKSYLENKYSIQVQIYVVDMKIKSNIKEMCKEILKVDDSIDCLINNVGVFESRSILEEEDGALESQIETNLYSAYYTTKYLLNSFLKQKSGHIFNISSIAGISAYGGSYSISKYAVQGFSSNLRKELIPHGIKVTTVMPGAVMSRSWSTSGVSPERIMEARDIADMIWASSQLSPQACVEEILLRPTEGDL